MAASRCGSGLNLHGAFVHGCGAWYVAIEGRAGRYKVVLYFLVALCSGAYRDPGSINALLRHQVVLRIDSSLSGQLVSSLFIGSRLANQYRGGISLLLQVESDVIEASLSLVVDASRAALVTIKADRAKRLGLRCRRWRRSFDTDRRGASSRLTLVILYRAGNRDRARWCTGCAQRGGVAAAADLTGGRAERVSEWPVLRAYALSRNGCCAAGLNRGRISRAAERRRIELLDGEVRRAIRELAHLLSFGDVAGYGVVAGVQPSGVDVAGCVVAGDLDALATRPAIGCCFLRVQIRRR